MCSLLGVDKDRDREPVLGEKEWISFDLAAAQRSWRCSHSEYEWSDPLCQSRGWSDGREGGRERERERERESESDKEREVYISPQIIKKSIYNYFLILSSFLPPSLLASNSTVCGHAVRLAQVCAVSYAKQLAYFVIKQRDPQYQRMADFHVRDVSGDKTFEKPQQHSWQRLCLRERGEEGGRGGEVEGRP